MQRIITISIIYFILGAACTFYITQKNSTLKKTAWQKYFTYIFIVSFILSTIAYNFYLNYIAIFILTVCLIELIYVWIKGNTKKYSILFISILFYLICSVAFYTFITSNTNNEILFVYTLIFCIDGFSQISGQLFGKKHIFPLISPNKTLEGMIGGFITAILTAFIISNILNVSNFKLIVITVLIYISGIIGDLSASYYKRLNFTKDYSKLIPGHGGFLDRFDSYICAGSLYCLYNDSF